MSITIRRTFGDPGGGKGRACSRACLMRSPTQSDAPRIATIRAAAGKLTTTNRRKPATIALEQRNELRGEPQRHDQPGQGVDPGKGNQDEGQEGDRAAGRVQTASDRGGARPR